MKPSGMRGAFAKGNRKRQAMYLIPNLCTSGNLFCGVFSILSVFNGNHLAAAIAILVAMVFDMLDGKLARLTNSTGQFGVEFDSLADVVSFGVAPGLLIYSFALNGQGMFGVAVMFAYVAMGAVRLARFNSTVSSSDSKFFTGLAIPAAAGVVASLVIFDLHITKMGSHVKPLLILVITLGLAFLMVSTIKYRSFKELKFRRGQHFTYLVWAILALMLIVAWPQVMIFIIFAGYALSGPVTRATTALMKATGKQAAKPESPVLDMKE
jgi:CDP-diacylglycerol--serine O-phosphatidyltransferase